MKSCRTISTWIVGTVYLACVGCSSFAPLRGTNELQGIDPAMQRVEIIVPGGNRYLFPRNQYRIEGDDVSGKRVVGWGEQYGSFGLVGRDFYSVNVAEGTLVRIERIDMTRSVLFGGLLSGVGIATYLGIRALTSSASDSPGTSNPSDVN